PSKLQNAQARILVSRDEQIKTLQRLRKAESHRREGLQQSIEAKNNLAERTKATKSINSKAAVSSRLRWAREKEAIRDNPGAWASLHAAGTKSITQDSSNSSSRTMSRRQNRSLSIDVGCVSLAFPLNQPKLRSPPSPLSPELISQPSGPRHEIFDSSGQAFHNLPSDRLEPCAGLSKINIEQPHRRRQRQRKLAELDGGGNANGRAPRTAPAHLFCGNVADAETGEPLELIRRRWEFPEPGRRASTAGPPGDGAGAVGCPGPRGDVAASGCESSFADSVERGGWKGLWCGEKESDEDREGQTSTSIPCDPDRVKIPQVEPRVRGGAGRRCRSGDGERWHDKEGEGTERPGGGDILMPHVAKGNDDYHYYYYYDSDSVEDNDDFCGTLRGRRHLQSTTDTKARAVSVNTNGVGSNHKPTSPLSPSVGRRKRPYTIGNGSSVPIANNQRGGAGGSNTSSVTFATDMLNHPSHQEPPTPRSTKRAVSPFWVPPPQEPPLLCRGLAKMTSALEAGWPDGTTESESGGDDSSGRERGNRRLSLGRGSHKSSPIRTRKGKWPIESSDDTMATFSSAAGTVQEDERVRRTMLQAQEMRDRYFSQIRQMIKDECAEEARRAAALEKAGEHPLRSRRLQLQHERERQEKRTLINWIRKDTELIVVQKMAVLGLIR
ncbi:unnamed protein product, partial [Ectocarpus sp. 12 AP-2014]